MTRIDLLVFFILLMSVSAIDALPPLGLGALAVIAATFGVVRRKAWKHGR